MILSARKIRKQYFRDGRETNWFNAVEETDLTPEEGKITEIVGRSGSGKTTLGQMLAGLLTPTEGQVLLDGTDIYSLGDAELSRLRNKAIGVIPQGQTGLASLTVMENVLAPLNMYGEATAAAREYAAELLECLSIRDLREVYVSELSGGELRRMAVARALIRRPGIIIADEPTGDLDEITTEQVLSLFRRQAETGAAVLIITHDEAVARYADRTLRMEKGFLSE